MAQEAVAVCKLRVGTPALTLGPMQGPRQEPTREQMRNRSMYDAKVGARDVRRVTEAVSLADRIDVLRLRIAWRAASMQGG